MRRSYPQLSPARRQHILDETRAAARMGSREEVPLAVSLLISDPSDTFVGSLAQARAVGIAQRARDAYLTWLNFNFERLGTACADSGAPDGGAWLRQQYTVETGETP